MLYLLYAQIGMKCSSPWFFYVRIKMDLRISFIINAYRNINNYQKYKEIELKILNSII